MDANLQATYAKFPNVTNEDELKASKLSISRLPEQPINWRAILFRDFNGQKFSIETVEDFRFVWKGIVVRCCDESYNTLTEEVQR